MQTKPVFKRTLSRTAIIFACASFGFAGGKAMAPHWFAAPGSAKAFVLPEASPMTSITIAPATRPVARVPTTGPSKSIAKDTRTEPERHGSVDSGE